MLRIALVFCLVSLPAHADSIEAGFGVNAPWGWIDGQSIGASAYIGFRDHFAVRGNLASYEHGYVQKAVGPGEASHGGNVIDAGIGLQIFPQRLWNGPVLELGYVRRSLEDASTYDDYAPVVYRSDEQTAHGMRGLVGWSVASGRLFVAAAVGAAYARYRGTETMSADPYDDERMTRGVNRWKWTPEAYVRFGITFGDGR